MNANQTKRFRCIIDKETRDRFKSIVGQRHYAMSRELRPKNTYSYSYSVCFLSQYINAFPLNNFSQSMVSLEDYNELMSNRAHNHNKLGKHCWYARFYKCLLRPKSLRNVLFLSSKSFFVVIFEMSRFASSIVGEYY